MIAQHGNSIIGTHFGTLAAIGALTLIHPGNRDGYSFAARNFRLEENVIVRLLHITVEKLYSINIFQRKGKAGSYKGLTGPTFTTGN